MPSRIGGFRYNTLSFIFFLAFVVVYFRSAQWLSSTSSPEQGAHIPEGAQSTITVTLPSPPKADPYSTANVVMGPPTPSFRGEYYTDHSLLPLTTHNSQIDEDNLRPEINYITTW